MKNSIWIKSSLSVIICLLVGFLSSLPTRSSILNWYSTINKPFFNPPNWIFSPVWTLLYIMMGIAAGIIWSKHTKNNTETRTALWFFVLQLGLNALWSLIFFGLENPFLAFVEILLLWLVIFETIKTFSKIDSIAGKLLYPYLAWVSFATILNGSIAYLNW